MHGQCKDCWRHQILVNNSNTKVITIYSREKQIDRKACNLCLTRSGCVTELLLHVDGDHCRKKTNRIKACDWIMAAVHRWFPTLFKRGKEIPNHTQRFPQNDWNHIKHTISSKLQTTSRQEKKTTCTHYRPHLPKEPIPASIHIFHYNAWVQILDHFYPFQSWIYD